jgi:CRP-like cAMP-binding protein
LTALRGWNFLDAGQRPLALIREYRRKGWYLTQRPASVNVIATTASRVLRVDRKNLEELELKHPDVHAKLIWIMGRDIADKLRKLNVVTEDKDQALSSFGPSTFESEIFSGRRAH